MGTLLKYGKQIMGLSSLTRSQQQQKLGFRFARYLTTKSHHLSSGDKLESPPETPLSFKGFFTNLFSKIYTPAPAPPPGPTPFKELLGMFKILVRMSKYLPDDCPPIYEFRPVLNALLERWSDESYVKLLYELARPAATEAEADRPILDPQVKEFVDLIPPNIMPFFQDMMFHKIVMRYRMGGMKVGLSPGIPTTWVDFTADVSDIGKEHLKVFVVKNVLMVTGTDRASPPAPVDKATPKIIMKMPGFHYLHHQVTASLQQDQLNILFPMLDDSVVVHNPKVFQVNLHCNQG